MKRTVLFAAVLLLLLSGCKSKVPEHIQNPKTEYEKVEDYKRADYTVPENYRHIQNGIYAVLDENGNVVGYMRLVEEDGAFVWRETGSSSSID